MDKKKIMDSNHITIAVKDALSFKDAANELHITTMTLWRWVRDRKIIAVKLGQYRFIPLSEIKRMKGNL